ncbi:MAG: hypothetical protein U5K70_09685 [Halodesulfurarchaeum sp.]|nr:hypothetical protein [Halodesulfurarchaeum sp.]
MAGVDRGVSTVVGYVLNLGLATILITGLLISGASLVADQRERTVRSELDVLGNRLAADLETADRLHRLGDGEVTLRTALPSRVAGNEYRIDILTTDGAVTLRLEIADSSISRTVPVRNTSRVTAGTVDGGDLVIDGSAGWLEVSNG